MSSLSQPPQNFSSEDGSQLPLRSTRSHAKQVGSSEETEQLSQTSGVIYKRGRLFKRGEKAYHPQEEEGDSSGNWTTNNQVALNNVIVPDHSRTHAQILKNQNASVVIGQRQNSPLTYKFIDADGQPTVYQSQSASGSNNVPHNLRAGSEGLRQYL